MDTLFVDKTGILTESKPKVTAIVPVGTLGESELSMLAVGLERASECLLASAIVAATDPVKRTTREAIGGLHRAGLHVAMVTARAFAHKLGLDEIVAGVSPWLAMT